MSLDCFYRHLHHCHLQGTHHGGGVVLRKLLVGDSTLTASTSPVQDVHDQDQNQSDVGEQPAKSPRGVRLSRGVAQVVLRRLHVLALLRSEKQEHLYILYVWFQFHSFTTEML